MTNLEILDYLMEELMLLTPRAKNLTLNENTQALHKTCLGEGFCGPLLKFKYTLFIGVIRYVNLT